jgi:hypothetical protein
LQHNASNPSSGAGTSVPTSQATPSAKQRPPLMKAARQFLRGIELPTPPKHGPNPNADLGHLFAAMMFHVSGLKDDATTATCSPSTSELAAIMFCSKRHVERRMKTAVDAGYITKQRRGNSLSNVYTIHQHPEGMRQLLTHHPDTTTVVASESQSDATTPAVRCDNSPEGMRQLGPSDATTVGDLRDLRPLEKDLRDLRPLGEGPAITATEVGSSGKTDGEWSGSSRPGVPAAQAPAGSTGLVIQATKKPQLPECQICRQLAGDFSAGIDPDPKGNFCERHDNSNYR